MWFKLLRTLIACRVFSNNCLHINSARRKNTDHVTNTGKNTPECVSTNPKTQQVWAAVSQIYVQARGKKRLSLMQPHYALLEVMKKGDMSELDKYHDQLYKAAKGVSDHTGQTLVPAEVGAGEESSKLGRERGPIRIFPKGFQTCHRMTMVVV